MGHAGAEFKVVFGNADIDFFQESRHRVDPEPVTVQMDLEQLLVSGCWGQDGVFHAFPEPCGNVGRIGDDGHFFDGFDFVGEPGLFTVSDADGKDQAFAFFDFRHRHALCRVLQQGFHPASLQAVLLRPEHQLFAIVAAQFVQFRNIFSDEGDIVGDAGPPAVTDCVRGQGVGYSVDELEMQACFSLMAAIIDRSVFSVSPSRARPS